ncbi:MAG: folylpolyglutamate synthase/dihydrofolate synthase family protein [Chloroflexota bacterium]|nr:folylpolyglutamate synthase/dihydrofolate synthase family protein [Chloroflexota bacterium]
MLTYREALKKIFEHMDFECGERPPYGERTWRLSRVEALLADLGDPHRAFDSVHIAGTKGKGSTTAMIESILRGAGYHTGMYTSPHLHTFRERIRLNGELIPEEDVAKGMERMASVLAARPEVTVFEIITALAFWYYAQKQIDIGVIEVGLGGRLDATNVLKPLVSVITSISKDHTELLGDTIEAIAREKAGIVKEGTPVVSAPQRPEAMRVIEAVCEERNAPLVIVGRDWCWRSLGIEDTGQRMHIYHGQHDGEPEYKGLKIPLLGPFQLENTCNAVAAVELLKSTGWSISKDAVQRGLANVDWPGRMEVLGRKPLVIVDGAHNPYSARRLLEAVVSFAPYRKLHLVFGAGRTHLPQKLLAILAPASDGIYVTQAKHPHATSSQTLQEMAHDLGYEAVVTETVEDAVGRALQEAEVEDLVLATGSLFVVAEAQRAWAQRQGLPSFPSDPDCYVGLFEVNA